MAESDPKVLYGEKCLPEEDVICRISVWIYRTVPTSLLIVGISGNIANIIVLSSKNIRNTPCFLLAFLAFFDILCLLSIFLITPAGVGYGIEIRSFSFLACTINSWLSLFSSDMSLCIVTIFTIERGLFILFPHQPKAYLTRNKSLIVTGVIALIDGPLSGYTMIGNKPEIVDKNGTELIHSNQNGFVCWRVSLRDSEQYLWYTLSTVFFVIVPFLVVAIGNLTILVHMYRRRRQGSSMESQTVMLLLITGLMLATLGPFAIFVFTVPAISTSFDISQQVRELLFAIVYSLLMANHALNFVLYAWKGTLFKKECSLILQELKSLRCECRST